MKTRTITIELPEDVAEAVTSRVEAGDFSSEGDVLAESFRYYEQEPDVLEASEEFEAWLKSEVLPVLNELDADPSAILSAEEVRATMLRTRQNIRKAS